MVVYTIFLIYPLFDTMRSTSFTHGEPDGRLSSGCSNFVTLLFDPTWSGPFWNAFWNNFVFFVIHMLVQNPIGLLLAALLSLPRAAAAALLPHR